MNQREVVQLVASLFGAYPSVPLRAETVLTYEKHLVDLDAKILQQAIRTMVLTSKFLPSIAEIREAAMNASHGPVRPALDAWGDVLAEIRRIGAYGAPMFSDGLVAEIVGMMGWRSLCHSDNDAADRARFMELYSHSAKQKRAALILAIGGASEVKKLAGGT